MNGLERQPVPMTAHRRTYDIACFAAIVMMSAAWASTTPDSYDLLTLVRSVAAVTLVVSSAFLLLSSNITWRFILGTSTWSLLFGYVLLLQIGGGVSVPARDLALYGLLTFALFTIFSCAQASVISKQCLVLIVGYAASVITYTLYSGGFQLAPLPTFVFDAATFGQDADLLYSQGSSKFYGMAALAAALIYQSGHRRSVLIATGIAIVAFFLLSTLSGGRGDIAVTAILLLYVLRVSWPTTLLFGLITSLILMFGWDQLSAHFSLLDRLAAFEHSLGGRDILLAQSVDLLQTDLRCATFGCGFGFFQERYGYELSMPPHNIIVEFVIAYGIPISVLGLLFAAAGVRTVLWREGSRSPFLIFSAFFIGIGLKSGTTLTSWFAVASLLYLSVLGAIRVGNSALRNSSSATLQRNFQ